MVNLTELKAGDTILLVSTPPKGAAYTPEMQPYLGTTVTIKQVQMLCVKIKEDNGRWAWTPKLIEGKVQK